MKRYLSYKDEMKRLEDMLRDIPTDEESINEEDEEINDDEIFSEHNSSSEDDLDSDEDLYESTDILSQNCYVGKDGTKWSKIKNRQNVRIPSHNVILKLPGNIGDAKKVSSVLDSWQLLIDDSILLNIVACTNKFIETIAHNFDRDRDAKETSIIEIKALIGLLYFGGLHKSSHVNVKDLWATDGTGLDIFHRTMSQKRFLFLLRCLRFDDITDRAERKQADKLAPIRGMFESFVSNCQNCYTVGEYITIDEKLEAFRGRCSFRQYIPNKPAKYGIKVFALVDSRTFYTWNLEIYAGKQPDGPYKTNNSGDEIVKRLTEKLANSGRNLTVDNWYTSYNLAKDLLKKKITLVGTIRKNKRELPKEFITGKNREVHSSLFGFQKHMTLVSYVPKKNKCVNVISTMHYDDSIDPSTGDAKKPEIITFYNLTKGAVDVVDEMSANFSTARISKRWPMVVFFSVLNTAAINARVLLLSAKSQTAVKSRRHFLKELALELIKEQIQERSTQLSLPRKLRQQLIEHCSPSQDSEPPKKLQKCSQKKRCHICPSKKDRKSAICCTRCNKNICSEHTIYICKECE
ncbi:piggyBac transposable element-derived protein 4-like [Uloborus diversus]|uniref:piggyBac transposable element-derived protein 4-like n=1 Tax=Uloborus diversus TaxID=327109 RepID=UPI00240A1B12|nr:piggyBac transposable element-derived protein 4-like [Uloborus diversus]